MSEVGCQVRESALDVESFAVPAQQCGDGESMADVVKGGHGAPMGLASRPAATASRMSGGTWRTRSGCHARRQRRLGLAVAGRDDHADFHTSPALGKSIGELECTAICRTYYPGLSERPESGRRRSGRGATARMTACRWPLADRAAWHRYKTAVRCAQAVRGPRELDPRSRCRCKCRVCCDESAQEASPRAAPRGESRQRLHSGQRHAPPQDVSLGGRARLRPARSPTPATIAS